jgi:hypothetical protein
VSAEITLVMSEICCTSISAASRGITFLVLAVEGATMAA